MRTPAAIRVRATEDGKAAGFEQQMCRELGGDVGQFDADYSAALSTSSGAGFLAAQTGPGRICR